MSTSNSNHGTSRLRRRWRWLGMLLAVVVVAGGAWGVYWAKVLRYTQSTDDAYVGGNVVQITPQISGTVIAIGADDTQFVKAGQSLVRLDQADARVALDQAEAQLARTVRDVRNLYATSAQLEAPRSSADRSAGGAERSRRRQRLGQLRRGLGRGAAARARCGQGRAGGTARRTAAARRQPRARRWHDPREPPAGARCGRGGAQRLPDARAYRVAGAGDRIRGTAQRAARAARGPGHCAHGGGAARSGVGGCELQGAAARAHARRPAGARSRPTFTARTSSITARSRASAPAPVRPSRCCRRRMPPATGSRSCSACRCASRSTRARSPATRCRSACR